MYWFGTFADDWTLGAMHSFPVTDWLFVVVKSLIDIHHVRVWSRSRLVSGFSSRHLFYQFDRQQRPRKPNQCISASRWPRRFHLPISLWRITVGFLEDHSLEINRRLAAPDPSSNHNAACKKRQPDTGNWLINGDAFVEWKTKPFLLWLHGPGGFWFLINLAGSDPIV